MVLADRQPVGQHLAALRTLVVRGCLAVGVAAAAAFAFTPALFTWLARPYVALLSRYAGAQHPFLQTLNPSETFKMSMTLALVTGTVAVLPYIFLEIWRFVRPGLHPREKRQILPVLLAGSLLFVAGAAFAYAVVLPFMLRFFWDYSLRLGIAPAWTIGHYLDFVLGTLTAFGFAFELPVVTSLLVSLGFLRAAQLAQVRRYAIFGICVMSALLTPADLLSMILMAIPLILLYEVAILAARLLERRRAKESL